MHETTKTKTPETLEWYEKVIKEAYSKNWRLISEKFWYMFFEREVKRTLKQKDCIKVKEFTEFIEYYRKNITTNGSYAKELGRKYDIVLETHKHEDIMENMKLYKTHLVTHPNKPPLQPSTYLNKNRFLDKWEVIKTTQENKWQDDIMKERGYTADQIKAIQAEVKAWESKQNKEITRGTWENVAHYALTWEIK